MDLERIATKNSIRIQGIAVRSCELRLERRIRDASGAERREYICGASGGPEEGYVLGVVGEDLSPMATICNSCPIPDALESRRACLNLVPIRSFGVRSLPMLQPGAPKGETTDANFPCRWFYTLFGQKQPRDNTMCLGCPYWFPRPPRERIPYYWPETQKMLRVVSGEESTTGPPTGFTPASRPPPARTWWQRLLQNVHL